ncbi:hypothetical protein [Nocardia wallacei]|uniref:hypothetical protein n=1 Tax=Nocardia wallacei TaxID=480035 RepID=UPI0024545001|nr:hypothetical protein [Nocardia wallacei]
MSTTTENTRSATEDALWTALTTVGDTPTPAATLADQAGIGASTARKILARWACDGTVTRHNDDDNPRSAVQWTLATTAPDTAGTAPTGTATPADTGPENTPAAPEPATPQPSSADTETPTGDTPDQPEGTDGDPEPAATPDTTDDAPTGPAAGDAPAKPDKLPPGALRGMVEDYLRDHPSEEFTPHQIGKALNHSSGAVHNALVRLSDTGAAEKTSDAPKKFTLATQTES